MVERELHPIVNKVKEDTGLSTSAIYSLGAIYISATLYNAGLCSLSQEQYEELSKLSDTFAENQVLRDAWEKLKNRKLERHEDRERKRITNPNNE